MDAYEGLPARLFRSPDEVYGEIASVRERIAEIERGFSVREMIFSVLSSSAEVSERQIILLREILEEANEALDELSVLSAVLSELREELSDIRCEMNL